MTSYKVCPRCGQPAVMGMDACRRCGRAFSASAAPIAAQLPPMNPQLPKVGSKSLHKLTVFFGVGALACLFVIVFIASRLSNGSPIRIGPSKVTVSELRADSINYDRQRVIVRGFVVGRSDGGGSIEYLVITDDPSAAPAYKLATVKVVPASGSIQRGHVVELDAYFDAVQAVLRAQSARNVGQFEVPRDFTEDGRVLGF